MSFVIRLFAEWKRSEIRRRRHLASTLCSNTIISFQFFLGLSSCSVGLSIEFSIGFYFAVVVDDRSGVHFSIAFASRIVIVTENERVIAIMQSNSD